MLNGMQEQTCEEYILFVVFTFGCGNKQLVSKLLIGKWADKEDLRHAMMPPNG